MRTYLELSTVEPRVKGHYSRLASVVKPGSVRVVMPNPLSQRDGRCLDMLERSCKDETNCEGGRNNAEYGTHGGAERD
jgi:hypothetical protein